MPSRVPLVLVLLSLAAVCRGNPVLTEEANKQNPLEPILQFIHRWLERHDPLNLPDLSFDLKLDEITAKGGVKNLAIKGVSGLAVDKLTLVMVDGKASIGITLPLASYEGDYDIDGKISLSGINVPVVGKGKVIGNFSDLTIDTAVELGISNLGQILLQDFSLVWNMSDIQLQLKGLYNDAPLGQMINQLLHDAMPRLVLQVYHEKITTLITTTVMEQGAKFLLDIHKDRKDAPKDHDWEWLRKGSNAHVAPASREDAGHDADVVGLQLLGPTSLHGAQNELHQPDIVVEVPEGDIHTVLSDSSGLLRVELVAEPRFYPHGALVVDGDVDADLSDGGHSSLLSALDKHQAHSMGLGKQMEYYEDNGEVSETEVHPQGGPTRSVLADKGSS